MGVGAGPTYFFLQDDNLCIHAKTKVVFRFPIFADNGETITYFQISLPVMQNYLTSKKQRNKNPPNYLAYRQICIV